MNQILAPIISHGEVTPGVHLVWLEAPEIASAARPGQFLMTRCGEDCLLRRPLSIHLTKGEQLALLFAVVGRGTKYLSQLREGDNLDVLGPLGNGFSVAPHAHKLLLVAGGVGVAPLIFLAREQLGRGKSVTLLLGATAAAELYPENLLPSRIKLIAVTEDGSMGEKGMVTDILPRFAHEADQIFACGPVEMYQAMVAQGIADERSVQVSLEVRMGCGMGACYGCTITTRRGTRQVCKGGPIFELPEIIWEEVKI
jgi:dihydroorotate dehydrogenase electron transfer subunit